MGNSFGERLKHERVARSLTQAELGGALYSASYISLLENGRREPTVEVIKQLSKQLQVTQHSIEEWSQKVSTEEAEYLLTSLYARQCWDTRDYRSAAQNAEVAARRAAANHDPVMWWNMSYLQANSLQRSGLHAESATVLTSLLHHGLTTESSALTVRTRQLLASALLGMGRLTEAIDQAKQAVALGAGSAGDASEEYSAYLSALQTLVGALTEAGNLDEAWGLCLTLAESIKESTPTQMAGEMHWVIGNVAFIRHDVASGLIHHERASKLLSPASDLSRWAQFNKATAWVRLSAGVVEPATLQAIERSELAHAVVGSTPAEMLEVSLLRARWLYLNGDIIGAKQLLETISSQREHLGIHIAGDTALLFGKVLKAINRTDDALEQFNSAKEFFTEAGAGERISMVLENIVEIEAMRRSAPSN